MTPTLALSPLDGRYQKAAEPLTSFFSEQGLIQARTEVEIAWLCHLCQHLPELAELSQAAETLKLSYDAMPADRVAAAVKEHEAITGHDVKAVEYFIRDLTDEPRLHPFIHFGATSEDINNLAYGLMIGRAMTRVVLPAMEEVLEQILAFAERYARLPMMARTHGQPASPTTLGKELLVYSHRLSPLAKELGQLKMAGKINGAVGNYNAHHVAYPELDWLAISKAFVTERLGLVWNPITTQIESHDQVVRLCQRVDHFNTILKGFCQDIWGYISLDYLVQATKPGEVGSSTMPHKVNPIHFENAEGNLGMACSIGRFLQEKLPISRWQRDLSDSTVQRNLGVYLGYSLISYRSILRGFGGLSAGEAKIAADLEGRWELLTEAVQMTMRRYGIRDAYERAKAISRGKPVDRDALVALIDQAEALPSDVKTRLKSLKPRDYTGITDKVMRQYQSAKGGSKDAPR